MCLKPRNVYNNTKSLRPIDKTHFSVPCGECEECQQIRRSEYTFRIYEQMRKCFRDGWNVYFGTLTYAVPPILSLYPHFSNCVTIKCFNKSDIIKFFRRLRKWVYQKYGVKGIVYVCASEFGHSTQQPHYHFMLSLPSSIDPQEVHDKVCKLWTHGFIFPRYLNGGLDSKGYDHKPFQVLERDCQNASFYIAKYCCKDLSFYGNEDVKFCLNFLKDKIKSSDIDQHTYEYITHLLHNNFTFVITSRHFGECINDLVKDPADLYVGVESAFSNRLVPIPNYNRRKLLFKVRKVSDDPSIKVTSFDEFGNLVTRYKVRYDLTEFGHRAFAEYVRRSVHSVCDYLNDFSNVHLKSEDFANYLKDNDLTFDSDKFTSNIRAISVYSVVYRNRCSPLHMQEYFDFPHIYNVKFRIIPTDSTYANAGLTWTMSDSSYRFSGSEDLSTMMSSAEKFYTSQLDFDRYLNEGIVNVKDVHNMSSVHFNSFPCFAGFDSILDVITNYLIFIRSDKVKSSFYTNLKKQIYKQKVSEMI